MWSSHKRTKRFSLMHVELNFMSRRNSDWCQKQIGKNETDSCDFMFNMCNFMSLLQTWNDLNKTLTVVSAVVFLDVNSHETKVKWLCKTSRHKVFFREGHRVLIYRYDVDLRSSRKGQRSVSVSHIRCKANHRPWGSERLEVILTFDLDSLIWPQAMCNKLSWLEVILDLRTSLSHVDFKFKLKLTWGPVFLQTAICFLWFFALLSQIVQRHVKSKLQI